MKKWLGQILLGGSLIACSALFYWLHYILFHDAHHIFVYLVGDIAFVFIEVLLVSVIIHRLLGEHEEKARREKLNMIIGVFYSEVGIKLLKILSARDPQIEKIQNDPSAGNESTEQKFARICRFLKQHHYDLEAGEMDWDTAGKFLNSKKDFLLRLLENTSLHEHESFADVLRSVFHLTEELGARESLQNLSGADRDHLADDVKRVYGQMTLQWMSYMKHLKRSYPYLFSLSQRMNPFDHTATPIVQKPVA